MSISSSHGRYDLQVRGVDSPGYTIAYLGNAGTYRILAHVAISCAASDQLSGLSASTCAGVTGPAWTFGPGGHTLTAAATDMAGNSDTVSTTFTITATPAELCALTVQFVQSSVAYTALNPIRRAFVISVAQSACAILSQITFKLSATAKAGLVNQYGRLVEALRIQGWLSAAQATTLETFASTV